MKTAPRLGRRYEAPAHAIDPTAIAALRPDHPALAEARTIFPSTRADASRHVVLISGKEQRKIGDRIVKGPWAGLRVYCLTLEERATCPKTCHHWSGCYGNTMPFARRHVGDHITLTKTIYFDIDHLSRKHPRGFACRLHILGDFMSVAYVQFWALMLRNYPGLHLFGFTARPANSDIGRAIDELNAAYPTRVRIRRSVAAPTGRPGETAPIYDLAAPRAAGAIQCPAQTHPKTACGSCGLCWSPAAWDRPILFALHGMTRSPRDQEQIAAIKVSAPRFGHRRVKAPWPVEKSIAFEKAWLDLRKTQPEIAAEFGIAAWDVTPKRKELGLPPRPRGRRSVHTAARFALGLPLNHPVLPVHPVNHPNHHHP